MPVTAITALCLSASVLLIGCAEPKPTPDFAPVVLAEPPPGELRSLASFAGIGDERARSAALFTEASRVITHPRCSNCHPSDDRPRQRDFEAHVPPVSRGSDDRGVAVLECASCHTSRNAELARVPGAPGWHLAPRTMGWIGKTVPEICAQIKDKQRNGGKTLAQIVDHSAHDELVAWGWAPGADRAPAPGTQAQFGALMAAWVETGAVCPPEEKAAK